MTGGMDNHAAAAFVGTYDYCATCEQHVTWRNAHRHNSLGGCVVARYAVGPDAHDARVIIAEQHGRRK